MQYEECNAVTDDDLCQEAFLADGAPDLWVAAAWAINGHRDESIPSQTPDEISPWENEDIPDAD
ncbi:hypothetical protein [Candidatus Igneacidithiobacillus taiwanensis]|uniref:hypothetical protein n=1 Tax=Candidatus Igneacidithiobacillus taiwanensis TaxID=1945924 RepID=UPI00289F853C|nr:hypothetical protein [Candidatus Igneacidithiobacillus taiwanensis]